MKIPNICLSMKQFSAQFEKIQGNGQRESDKRNRKELQHKYETDLFSFVMFSKLPLPGEEIVFMST